MPASKSRTIERMNPRGWDGGALAVARGRMQRVERVETGHVVAPNDRHALTPGLVGALERLAPLVPRAHAGDVRLERQAVLDRLGLDGRAVQALDGVVDPDGDA